MTRDVGPVNDAVFLLPLVTETSRCEERRQQSLPGWQTAERAFRVNPWTFAQLPPVLSASPLHSGNLIMPTEQRDANSNLANLVAVRCH